MKNGLIGWVRGDERPSMKALPLLSHTEPAENQGTGSVGENMGRKDVERECNRISPKAQISDAVLVVPEEDVAIHGRWTGTGAKIQCHTLYVEEGAVVEGEVRAKRVSVRGHITGEITTNVLSVHAGALVEGNVRCDSMRVEPKSRMRATILCDDEGAAGVDLPMPVNEHMEGGPRLRMVSTGRAAF